MSQYKSGIKATITSANGIYRNTNNNIGVLEVSGPDLLYISSNYSSYNIDLSNIPQISLGSIDNNGILHIGTTNNNSIIQSTILNNTSKLHFQPLGGKIGIHTDIPLTSLDISSNNAIAVPYGTSLQTPGNVGNIQSEPGMLRYNTSQYMFQGRSNEWIYGDDLFADNNNNTYINVILNNSNYSDIHFVTNENIRCVMTSNGRIGINNTTPSYHFDCDSSITYIGNLFINLDVFIEMDSFNSNDRYTFNDILTLTDNYVGIGTIIPTSKLNILSTNDSVTDFALYNFTRKNINLFIGNNKNNGSIFLYDYTKPHQFDFYKKTNGTTYPMITFSSNNIILHDEVKINNSYNDSCHFTICPVNTTLTGSAVTNMVAKIYGNSSVDILRTVNYSNQNYISIGYRTIKKDSTSGSSFTISNAYGSIYLDTNATINFNCDFYTRKIQLKSPFSSTYLDIDNYTINCSSTMYIQENNTNKTRFVPSGSVSIGTTSTSGKLKVAGDGINTHGYVYIGDQNEAHISRAIHFSGTYNDNDYNHTVIESRSYGATNENKFELLLFKGNDKNKDRINVSAYQIRFDTLNNGNDRTTINSSIVMQSGKCVIAPPTEDFDFDDYSHTLTVHGNIGTNVGDKYSYSRIGKAAIGYCGFQPYFSFSHIDKRTTEAYAYLFHPGTGTGYLNSNNGLYINGNGNATYSIMSIITDDYWQHGGFVGIGTATPKFPLHIHSKSTSYDSSKHWTHTRYIYWASHSGDDIEFDYFYEMAAGGISIYVDGDIFAGSSDSDGYHGIAIGSDRRIKKNIVDVPDNLSLFKLRNIPVRSFRYKDPRRQYNDYEIGFIAQEVKEIEYDSLKFLADFIPDELKFITIGKWEKYVDSENEDVKYKLYTNDLSYNNGIEYKFFTYNDLSLNGLDEIEVISTMNDDGTFIFDTSYNHVYCYGKKVEDLHTIDHARLFAINFSASQEILRIQKQEIEKLKIEENKLVEKQEVINNQMIKINELKNEILNLSNRVNKLLLNY